MKGDDWEQWFVSVVIAQNEQLKIFQQQRYEAEDLLQTDLSELLLPHASNPATLWAGDESTKRQIEEYWERYSLGQTRRWSWVPDFQLSMVRGWRGGVSHKIWKNLRPYQGSLEMLLIYLVEYPQPATYLVLPYTTIISVVNGQVDKKAFYNQVIQSAKDLVHNQEERR